MAAGAPRVRFVSYLRVSTDRQGRSGLGLGLGLEAQRAAVAGYIDGQRGELVAEYQEVESGKRNNRPELEKALAACRTHRATLIIAKLDRLTRNARFLLSVVEGTSEGGVVFCDLPTIPTGPVGKFLVTQLAAVAELEAGLISQRTKAALAQAKARGVKLGGARDGAGSPELAAHAAAAWSDQTRQRAREIAPYLTQARTAGARTLQELANALNARGITTARGGVWYPNSVKRVMARIEP